MRREINQFIDGAAPDRRVTMSQQLDQQRNRSRTNPLDNFEGLEMQAFIASVEESTQQRKRTSRPLDQGRFGSYPHLRVLSQQPLPPVKRQGGISGKTGLRRNRP